jgi:hypothetical protein
MLQLDCNHNKVVGAKNSIHILSLIFNYNIILLKSQDSYTWVHCKGSSQRPYIWDDNFSATW